MYLRTKLNFRGETSVFDLDTAKFDRNYCNENYALWIVQDKAGHLFEIHVNKDADGLFTNRGLAYAYDRKKKFKDGITYDAVIDIFFSFHDPEKDRFM